MTRPEAIGASALSCVEKLDARKIPTRRFEYPTTTEPSRDSSLHLVAKISVLVFIGLLSACDNEDAVPPSAPHFTVDAPAARACDVLLDLGDAGIGNTGVVFAASARGEFLQRGSALAISFITRKDQPFDSDPVSIDLPGSQQAGMTISRAACYDRLGVVIPGAHVTAQ